MGYLAIVVASIIGAVNMAVLKAGLDVFTPQSLMFFRFFFALVFISAYYLTKHKKLQITVLRKLLIPSTFSFLALFFIILGLVDTTISNSQIIMTASPIFTTIFARTILFEKITKYQFLGLALGIFGAVLTIIEPIMQNSLFSSANLYGNMLVLLAAISSALYFVYSKKFTNDLTLGELVFGTVFVSTLGFGVATIVAGIKAESFFVAPMHTEDIFNILFLSLIGTLGMFYLLQYGINKVGAFFSGISQYIQLPIVVLLGILLFGEKISETLIIGSLLILIGALFAVSLSNAKPKSTGPA